ncbi:MAG: DUF4375 domain-containing protein [Planctomycetota bacterium]
MLKEIPMDALLVSKESFDDDEPSEIAFSNMSVVDLHLSNYFTHDELSKDAMRAYMVEFFYCQLQNGGFAQFAYNFDWAEHVEYLTEGLEAVGAIKHLELFEQICAKLLEDEGLEKLKTLLQSDFFDENPERDEINDMGEEFWNLEKEEYLEELVSKWIRSLPSLVVLPTPDIESLVKERVEVLPDLDSRIQKAKDDAPQFEKLILVLCEKSGQELDTFTAGDPSHVYEGNKMMAWHFITDQGHHHMVEDEGKAIMFKGHTTEVVCEIDAELLDGEEE